MAHKIEKGIPVEGMINSTSEIWNETFDLLEPGDSFTVSCSLKTGRTRCSIAKKGTTKRFIAKQITENRIKKVRIWRLE